jgi:hypothetical protein
MGRTACERLRPLVNIISTKLSSSWKVLDRYYANYEEPPVFTLFVYSLMVVRSYY